MMTSCLHLSQLITWSRGRTGWVTQKLFSQVDELMEPNAEWPDLQETAPLKHPGNSQQIVDWGDFISKAF